MIQLMLTVWYKLSEDSRQFLGRGVFDAKPVNYDKIF